MQPVLLIANGIPNVSVRLRPGAIATEEFAADELFRFLCRMADIQSCLRSGNVPVFLNDVALLIHCHPNIPAI